MATTHRRGLRKLIKACPAMAHIRRVAGLPAARHMPPGFATLLRIIVNQQVSTQSGAAIWKRLAETVSEITPDTIVALDEAGLKAVGFSRAKARYGLALSESILDGSLPLDALSQMSGDRVTEALVKVKGIGRWTAEIYLMVALGRSDVWPAGDTALAEATGQLLSLPHRPDVKQMDEIAERWRPWRSTAALMLWHYYRHLKGRPMGAPGT